MFGHLLRHDNFIKNIIEGKIEARRGRGRPRRAYTDQIKEKLNVVSYREVKDLAEDRTKWLFSTDKSLALKLEEEKASIFTIRWPAT